MANYWGGKVSIEREISLDLEEVMEMLLEFNKYEDEEDSVSIGVIRELMENLQNPESGMEIFKKHLELGAQAESAKKLYEEYKDMGCYD